MSGVTSQPLTEEAETRLREVISTLDLASVFVRAFDGRIQFWSKGCEDLYGWSAEEAIGEDFRKLLRVSFLTPLNEIEAALLTNGSWAGDLIHHRRDGEKLTIAARKVLRRDTVGSPAAVMENVSDVSALRSAQAELQRLNESLAVRVQMEVTARETAQLMLAHAQRMQALGQLAGGIAHDFNNVIQAVDGAAALIEIRSPNAELRRLSSIIRDASHRGAAVTRRLLTFTRRGELHAELFDIGTLLGGFPEMLQGALGAGIGVSVALPPDLPSVFADRAQLETVLVNLATNARDAMPAGGTITLSASRAAALPEELAPGDYIRLDIADTGNGMEADILRRAMEPFFTTKPIGQGTGLGLSRAKGFAEQSGGAIAIRSAPGEGSCVSLFLPAQETAPGDADAAAPAPPPRADAQILLVDDEELVREVVGEHLAEHSYTVSVAESGESALTLLGEGLRPDLMITDYAMPGMNGLSLIRAVQDSHPRMPCLMLTGYAGDAADLLKGTSVSLLGKPVTATALLSRVASLLPPDRHSAAA